MLGNGVGGSSQLLITLHNYTSRPHQVHIRRINQGSDCLLFYHGKGSNVMYSLNASLWRWWTCIVKCKKKGKNMQFLLFCSVRSALPLTVLGCVLSWSSPMASNTMTEPSCLHVLIQRLLDLTHTHCCSPDSSLKTGVEVCVFLFPAEDLIQGCSAFN